MVAINPAYSEFLKKNSVGRAISNNAAGFGAVFIAPGMISEIAKANGGFEKMKAAMKGLISLALPMNALLGIGLFKGMKGAITSILHDTGSLEAALERLGHIQSLQRAFAPFLGGLDAAKRKVAELVNFAAKSPFQFGDVAAGAKTLQAGTRGLTGGKEMKIIGDAAAASGNNFADASSAVTDFFATVRSGGSIEGITENLRQMGLVSGIAADQLVAMQKSGVDADTIFASLMGTLAAASGGMADMADDVGAVNDAYEKAAKNLKEKFGAPFTENDITNTKNMTAVMISLAPAVSSLASFFQILTTGLSTAFTTIAKWVTGSDTLTQSVVLLTKALAIAAAAVSALSAIALANWLSGAGGLVVKLTQWMLSFGWATGRAATAIEVLGVALQGLRAAAVIGIIIAVATVAAGVLMNYTNALNRATDAMLDLDKANRQAQANLRAQIADIKTLTDFQDALTKAIQERTAAQEALNAIDAEWAKKKEAAQKLRMPGATQPLSAADVDEEMEKKKAEDPAYVAAKGNLMKMTRIANELITTGPGKLGELTSKQEQELATRGARRSIAAEDEKFQARLAAGGANRGAIMMERAKVVSGREDLARRGNAAALELEKRRADMAGKIADSQKEILDVQSKGGDTAEAKKKLATAEIKAFQLGLAAPAGTAMNLQTRVAMMEKGQESAAARKLGNIPEADRLAALADSGVFQGTRATKGDLVAARAQLEIQKEREATDDQQGAGMKREAALAARDERNARAQEQSELQSAQLRRAGKTEEAVRLDDVSSFTEKYGALRAQGVGVDEATKRATAMAQEGILQGARAGGTTVADSLQRIGGGGGSYGVDSDAMLQTAKRQTALLDSIAKVVLQFENVDMDGNKVL